MKKYKLLILTDHRIHGKVDSLYPLAQALQDHPACELVHVATRGDEANQDFFKNPTPTSLQVVAADENFVFSPEGKAYTQTFTGLPVTKYDAVLLRLPRVNSMDFFSKIEEVIPSKRLLNQPKGIIQTGSKDFLTHFQEWSVPLQVCFSLEEVEKMASRFPIVLKPLNNSGGRGILKIDGQEIWEGNQKLDWESHLSTLKENLKQGYLAMQFLKNVSQGDKRIIVVNGEVVACALRVPAAGSWMANVSQGATSQMTEMTPRETEMAQKIGKELLKKGVVLFGLDTLVDDEGQRILSELNTSCVNGIWPAEMATGKPIVRETAGHLFTYIQNNIIPQNEGTN